MGLFVLWQAQPIASGKPLQQAVLASVPLTTYHPLLPEEVTN